MVWEKNHSPPEGVVISLSIQAWSEGEHFVERALPSLLSQRRDADTNQWKIFFLIFADKETMGFLRSSDANVCYEGFHFDFIECNFESLDKTSEYSNYFRLETVEKLGFFYAQKLNVHLHFSSWHKVYKKNFLISLNREIKHGCRVLFALPQPPSETGCAEHSVITSYQGNRVMNDFRLMPLLLEKRLAKSDIVASPGFLRMGIMHLLDKLETDADVRFYDQHKFYKN